MLKSKVQVLIKIAEMTAWEKNISRNGWWCKRRCREEKKMPGELFKGAIRFFDYCGHSDWEIFVVIYGRQFIKLLLIYKATIL